MFRRNRFILGILKIFYFIANILGLMPLRFNKRSQTFKYSRCSLFIAILFPVLSVGFPLMSVFWFVALRQYVGEDYLAQNAVYTVHITGSTTVLFFVHWKNHKKICECAASLLHSFQSINKKYRRNQFAFDELFLITTIAKIVIVVKQITLFNLDPFGMKGGPIRLFTLSLIVSSLVHIYVTIAYLMIGAMFDNILTSLEKNYDRICIDKQIEGREIYFDETFLLYLDIRKCFEQLLMFLNPIWILSGTYLVATISYNYWQLYFSISMDNEMKIIQIELINFLITLFAASIVPFKGKRVERFLGVFCLEGINSQREDLEWIDFTRHLHAEFNATVLHCIRLRPFYSIVGCILLLQTVDLFLEGSDLFEQT